MNEPITDHTPVLTAEVLEHLDPQPGWTVLDATVGHGGHARRIAERLGPAGRLVGLDVDPASLEVARQRLSPVNCRIDLRQVNYRDARNALSELQIDAVDAVLVDLGVSSAHLDDPARGFSFKADAPLDMRMDPTLEVTAADLVNRLKERELADVLYYNAQEMASRKIARRICEVRREGRITTTGRLVEVVASALGVDPTSRKSKIHPATRTFQALRMAVNDEMGALDALLADAPSLLRSGGRIGVISYHSVEDRRVKRDFLKRRGEGVYELVTRKPVTPTEAERQANPRSRSAKLRVAQRI